MSKREKVMAAAIELFRDSHQPRKVSIEDIARRAGVSPTTIYHYFGNREALVKEVAKSLVVSMAERAREFIQSPLPFDQKLTGIIAGKVELTSRMDDEVVGKMVSQDPDMKSFVDRMFKSEFYPLWHEFLRQGKAEGYIDPELDEEAFIVLLDILRSGLSSRQELLVEWRKNMGPLEKITRIFFYGFLRKEIELFQTKRSGESDEQHAVDPH